MGSYSKIVRGPRQRRPAKLPLPGASFSAATNDWEGPTVPLDIVALSEDEYGDVLKEARAYAQKKGLAQPEPGDELYERGLMVYTIARACLDADERDTEKPFFDGGAEQILGSQQMTPEIVAYLYGLQQTQQDACNPLVRELSPAEFMGAVIKTAGGDPSFFVSSRLGTQWSFTRTLASLHLASMQRESLSSGPTDAAQPTSE